MTGFIQLINTLTDTVVSQRIGDSGEITYFKNRVWIVVPPLCVKHVMRSEVSQPWKFFAPVPKSLEVYVYDDCVDNVRPVAQQPSWVGTAQELETLQAEDDEDVLGECWSAFSSTGQWLGTSEF
ncbi:hypothetical protein CJ419_09125 [Vibrio navarrensis]|nr:hypothetical protein [Vibrio navarrensis]